MSKEEFIVDNSLKNTFVQKDSFKAKIEDGTQIELAVVRPTHLQEQESQKVYNRMFRELVESGTLMRVKMNEYMENNGVWDKEKDKKLKEYKQKMAVAEKQLEMGGIKKSEARAIAVEMVHYRNEYNKLLTIRNNIDQNTAEAQAENARFNYLVSVCTVYNDTRKPYFKNYDDYLKRAVEPISIVAATKFAKLYHNLDDDMFSKYPENRFLKELGFMNEKNQLVDAEGRLVDLEGNLVDEFGRRVNDKGQLVDEFGMPFDEKGNYIVSEKKPFIDD